MTKTLKDALDVWLKHSKIHRKVSGDDKRKALGRQWFHNAWTEMNGFVKPGMIEHGSEDHIKHIEDLTKYLKEDIKFYKEQNALKIAKYLFYMIPPMIATIASIIYLIDWWYQ